MPLGQMFQWFIILAVKNVDFVSTLNLPDFNSQPLVLLYFCQLD